MQIRMPRPAVRTIGLLVLLGLSACDPAQRPVDSIAEIRSRFSLPEAQPSAFLVCHGHGCQTRTAVSLAATQWEQVRTLMLPPAPDAVTERQRIAQATALLETLVAPQAGTGGDVGGTFSGLGRGKGQLDCEDEAINTTQYLVMMHRDGLLRFHTPVGRRWRGNFLNGWPHTTAIVVENASGREWAIDSWFEDNGRPAHVVAADIWRAGWSPDNKTGPQYGSAIR